MFETDQIEQQFASNPGLAYKNIKRKFILCSIFLTICGALAAIHMIGIFIAFIAGLWVSFDFSVHLRVLCEEKRIKRGKRFLIFIGWFLACLIVGIVVTVVFKGFFENYFTR